MNTTINSGQLYKFLELLEQKKMTPDRFQTLWPKLAKVFTNYNVSGSFRFTIDYMFTISQMVDAGSYDWVNPDFIGIGFQVSGSGEVEYEACYFDFPEGISSEDAIATIIAEDPRNPWEAARVEHICSFGAKFSEEQRKHPVVGLGSVAKLHSRRDVPCLWGDGSERRLSLRWFGGECDGRYRFLAVRKVLVS